jgi:hypothetical protein
MPALGFGSDAADEARTDQLAMLLKLDGDIAQEWIAISRSEDRRCSQPRATSSS